MSKSLGTLTLDLVAKIGGFTGPIDKAQRHTRTKTKEMQSDFKQTAAVIQKAAGVIGVALSASAFTSFIKGTVDAADGALNVAEKLGTTTEELSKLRYAAAQSSGMVSGEFDVALQRMTRRLGEAAKGGGVAKGAIEELGLSAQALAAADPADAFKQIMEQMSKLPDQSDRVRLAFKFFDSGGVKLAQTAIQGADGIEELSQRLEDLGGVISTKTAEQAAGFNAKMADMRMSVSGLGLTIATEALPAMNAFVDALSSPAAATAAKALTVGVTALSVVMAGKLVAAGAAAAFSFATTTVQTVRLQLALASLDGHSRSAAVGLGVMTVAARAASGAMALLGGPVGVITLAASALLYFTTRADGAGRSAEELDARINKLAGGFDGLSAKAAAAAIVDYQRKIESLKGEVASTGDEMLELYQKVNSAPDSRWAQGWRDEIVTLRSEQEKTTKEIDKTEDALKRLKSIVDAGPLNGLSEGAAAASSTFEKMNQQIAEQIILINNKTAATQLAARIEAGFVDGLLEGEAEKLIAYQAEADALKLNEERSKAAAAAAESQMKSQQSAAESAAKKAAEATKAIQDSVTALELQASQFYMNADAVKLYELKVKGATDAQLKLAEASLATIEVLEAQKKINEDASGIIEGLRTEEEAVQASYDKRKEIILASTELTEAEKTEAMLRLQKKRDQDLLDAGDDYWAKYLSAAEKALLNFDALAESTISNFSSRFGSAFEAMIFDAQTLEDAMFNLAEGMVRSVVNAIGQMIAQWVAYQAVQLLVGKTTQASGVAAISANAAAASLMSGLNAFSSTAAIPIEGPALAPAAMGAAISITAPLASAVSLAAGAGLAGMAHDGIDSIPEDGTWLLQKGERVTTAGTSDKLDRTLEQIRQGQQAGGGNMQFALTIYADGKEQGAAPPELAGMVNGIKSIVNEQIMTAMRPGGPLNRR